MARIVSIPVLGSLIYLNAGLAVVAWGAGCRWPTFVTYFAVALPFVLAFALVPGFVLRGRFAPPTHVSRPAMLFFIPMFIAVLLAENGAKQQALLRTGRIVTGITVEEAPAHRDAVAFEFSSARGDSALWGATVVKHGKSSDTWIAVPLMSQTWTPNDPVTVWALCLDKIPPELAAGEFRAGVIPDDPTVNAAAVKAVADAEKQHHLRSHTHSVVLRMNKSLQKIQSESRAMLVMAFVGLSLAWIGAVAIAR